MFNQIASSLRRGSGSRRNRNANVNVQVMNEDQVMAQIQGQNSGGALPRELRNLGDNPHIVVNHTYNLHYQSDRPSEQHMQDVVAYGQDYAQAFNARSLEICTVPTSMCVDFPHEPSYVPSPVLRVEPYFSGTSGIPKSKIYVPDAKYIKSHVREYSGEEIDLRQLHQNIGPDGTQRCHHVALVGNQGCGKTVLCKKYASMVLNKEIPELADVEFVHFMDMSDFHPDNDRFSTINELLFDRLVNLDQNTYKYGYEWMTRNPEKLLLIFDGAELVLSRFREHIEPINYASRAVLFTVLQNILNNHIFRGCRTLISARDWAFKGMWGNCRPQKFVMAGPLTSEQRILLTRSLCPTDLMLDDYCDSMLRKFPAGYYLAQDVAFLYFAVSSLKWGDVDNNARITTDVMLVTMMLQHLFRTWNSSGRLVAIIGKFPPVAFRMIEDGVIRRNLRELKKHRMVSYDDMLDVMAVAPQHKLHVYYRLLSNDYSYFFPNQVLQEIFAACFIAELPMPEFNEAADSYLHTLRWLVVRRFVCGFVLHEDTKRNTEHLVNRPKHAAEMEPKLLSSLESQVKKMSTLSSYERLELLASLYECGAAAKPIIKAYVRTLVLPGIFLDSYDLYAISQIERYVEELQQVDICLSHDVNIEEFDSIAATIVNKGVKARLDLSRLHLTSGHISGLERPLKDVGQIGKLISLQIVASKQTSSAVIKLFGNLSKAITVEQADFAEKMIE